MRERSPAIRETQAPAAGASRTAARLRYAAKAAAFVVAVSVFLAFVGAFGSDALPLAARYGLFIVIGFVCFFLAWGAVGGIGRIPALAGRRWARQIAVVALLTPASAVAVWAIVGFAVLGGPKPDAFPAYLLISLGMTVAMSALSQIVFREQRFRALVPADSEAPPSAARFLERLPASLKGAELWAVQAEDHYVRLHTSRGSTLILLRLADAAAELEGLEGARVHRSWWVARAAVAGTARKGAQTVLKLPNGLEAPVSRAQAAELRRAGWW